MSLSELTALINDWVLGASGAWWVLPVVALLCLLDGFFPVLPSESLVVALASVWASSMGWWWLPILAVLAGAGAFLGDQAAYKIGAAVGTSRWAWMRRGRVRRAMELAEHQLRARGAVLIFTARYIPIGRVAVNLTAGATGFSHLRFSFFDALGCLIWGAYSVGVGALAGQWLESNHLMAIVVSIVLAVALGWVLDRLIHRFLLRFHRRHEDSTGRLAVVAAQESATQALRRVRAAQQDGDNDERGASERG